MNTFFSQHLLKRSSTVLNLSLCSRLIFKDKRDLTQKFFQTTSPAIEMRAQLCYTESPQRKLKRNFNDLYSRLDN